MWYEKKRIAKRYMQIHGINYSPQIGLHREQKDIPSHVAIQMCEKPEDNHAVIRDTIATGSHLSSGQFITHKWSAKS